MWKNPEKVGKCAKNWKNPEKVGKCPNNPEIFINDSNILKKFREIAREVNKFIFVVPVMVTGHYVLPSTDVLSSILVLLLKDWKSPL